MIPTGANGQPAVGRVYARSDECGSLHAHHALACTIPLFTESLSSSFLDCSSCSTCHSPCKPRLSDRRRQQQYGHRSHKRRRLMDQRQSVVKGSCVGTRLAVTDRFEPSHSSNEGAVSPERVISGYEQAPCRFAERHCTKD